MNQKQKSGFSLVEVMLLFTVLAVVLAASIPLISTKSNPVPKKVPHGVYRCINGPQGLIEEVYTATRQVVPRHAVGECSFRVPDAVLFRVDMYSAGAGGTLFAEFDAANDDFRSAVFTSDMEYSDFQFTDDEGKASNMPPAISSNPQSSLLELLQDGEIADYFNGQTLIQSVYTGDAGKGGDASLLDYFTPAESSCAGYISTVSNVRANYKDVSDTLDPNSAKYDPTLKAYDEKIAGYQQQEKDYDEQKETAEKRKKARAEYKKWSDDMSTMISYITKYKNYGNSAYEFIDLHSKKDYDQGGISGMPGLRGNWLTNLNRNIAYRKYLETINNAITRRNSAYRTYIDNRVESRRVAFINEAEQQARANNSDKTSEEIEQAVLEAHNSAVTEWETKKAQVRQEELLACPLDNLDGKSHGYTVGDYISDGYYKSLYFSGSSSDEDYNPWNGAVSSPTASKPLEYGSSASQIQNGIVGELQYGGEVSRASEFKSYYDLYIKSSPFGRVEPGTNCYEAPSDLVANAFSDSGSQYYKYKYKLKKYCYTQYLTYVTGANGDVYKIAKIAEQIKKDADDKIAELDQYQSDDNSFDKQIKDAEKAKNRAITSRETSENQRAEAAEPIETELNLLSEKLRVLEKGDLTEFLVKKGYYTKQDIADYARNVQKQLETYCKALDVNTADSDKVQIRTATKDVPGGKAGEGRLIRVRFPITMKPDNNGNINIQEYMRNLRTPGSLTGFYPKKCQKVLASGMGDNCINASTEDFSKDNPDLQGLNLPEINYGADRTNPEVFSSKTKKNTTERTALAGDGKDLNKDNVPYPYAAWSLPTYVNNQPIDRADIVRVTSLPTGGKKANLKVTEKDMAAFSDTEQGNRSIDQWIEAIFKNNYAYNITDSEGAKGTDLKFNKNIYSHKIYDNDSVTARVDFVKDDNTTEDNPAIRDIRILINSSLWTKQYSLGKAGYPGKHTSFLAAGLGANCQFTVPPGGAPYDLVQSQESVHDLEQALTVSMRCFNRRGRQVFERELAGGTYDTEILEHLGARAKFYWYQGVPTFSLNADELDPDIGRKAVETWQPTSIWARAYNLLMGGAEQRYDLSFEFQIGMAGHGTQITDTCVQPHGFYQTRRQFINDYGYNLEQESITDDGEPSPRNEYPNEGCYGWPDQDTSYVPDYNIVIEQPAGIDATAGSGGGAAVVITW